MQELKNSMAMFSSQKIIILSILNSKHVSGILIEAKGLFVMHKLSKREKKVISRCKAVIVQDTHQTHKKPQS